MADGNAWRLVSRCVTVEDLVRAFRTFATADGLENVPVTGTGPADGAKLRVTLSLASKVAVLDGDAVVATGPGVLSIRFVSIDVRGKGLLAYMVEHRGTQHPPPLPRHLVPLGAPLGTGARGDGSATCTIESVAASGPVPVPRPSEPTIRGPAVAVAVVDAAARPKREMQKTLMGMPTIGAPARSKPATAPPPPAPPGVVATGTPPGVPADSLPVPTLRGGSSDTAPTQPTRGSGTPSPAIAAAAQALAAAPLPFDQLVTVRTAAPRRVVAAPSGPVDDLPTLPNEDLVTDVAVELPDLPSDYVDPIVEPPSMPAPVPLAHAPAGSSPGWPVPPGAAMPAMPVMAAPAPHYPTPYLHPGAPLPGTAPVSPHQPGYGTGPAAVVDWRAVPNQVELDQDMTEMVQLVRPGVRRRWPVIAVTSGVIVIGVAAMVISAASSGDGDEPAAVAQQAVTATAPRSTVPPAVPGSDAADPGSGEVAVPSPGLATESPPPSRCRVAFTSSPAAAEVTLAGQVIGSTPFTHDGPCTGYQVTFRRDRYQRLNREVGASATAIDVRLERPMFRVKVSSRPSGATVTVGGKQVGKTPVTIALPGFETTSIVLTRKDHAPVTQRVYAGKSGQRVDLKLKPRGRQ